jgi:hypothetical protein
VPSGRLELQAKSAIPSYESNLRFPKWDAVAKNPICVLKVGSRKKALNVDP